MKFKDVKQKIIQSEKIDDIWKLINNLTNEDGTENDEIERSFNDTFSLFDEEGDINSPDISQVKNLDGSSFQDELD